MTTDNFTEAAYTEAERRFDFLSDASCFEQGAEWARTHLAAQEPADAEIEAAQTELVLHAPDFTKPGVIRCHCGAPGFWGTPDAHEQHALWHALRAARRDEEDR